MVFAKGDALPVLENGRLPNKSDEKVPLGKRFEEQVKHVCTLIAPCGRNAGYLVTALLGSVILVLAAVSPFVASFTSFGLARLAVPGYNTTWDRIGEALESRIRGPSAYVLWAAVMCSYVYYAYILLTNVWILCRWCQINVTSPTDLRSRLIMWTLITHFRRISLLLLFLLITVLAVYPLVLLGVPCLSGIVLVQLCAIAAPTWWNLFLRKQHCVIMCLTEQEVTAVTMNKRELNRRFNKAGIYPGI
ncbi:hypothetical protein AAVH_23501 [Aphelenchoides avenae]|nr:hypothetical protein AAVH_23501 [Aphelenchus avenae]